jgi:hypothetical protein
VWGSPANIPAGVHIVEDSHLKGWDFDAAGEFTGGIHHWFWKGRIGGKIALMNEFNCFVGSVIV